MKKIILVDGNSIIFRAYYATTYPGATLMQTSSGIYTNALFAFINMIDKIKELSFDHILFAFDTSEPTKRHEMYDDYKAGRAPMPEELAMQFDLVEQYLEVSGFHHYKLAGYEADDIIGTVAREGSEDHYQVEIYSSDRDLLQLVNENTTVHLIKKGMGDIVSYTPQTIKEEFGLNHHQMIDYKALTGDPSDNIPGVPGVGPKTAQKLLQEYHTLDNVLANSSEIKGSVGQKIRDNHEAAIKSKILVTIDQNVPLPFKVTDLKNNHSHINDLIAFYQKYELHSLARRLIVDEDIIDNNEFEYIKLTNDLAISQILEPNLSFYLEIDSENYHLAEIWGLGISNGKKSYFVAPEVLLSSSSLIKYLEDDLIPKNGYNIKELIVKLKYHEIEVKGFTYDLLLTAYIINPNFGKEELARITLNFEYDQVNYDEVIYGKGAKKGLPEDDKAYQAHIASKAMAIASLKDNTLAILKENDQLKLLEEVELPLAYVLAEMEYLGIKVDQVELKQQETKLSDEIDKLVTEIYIDTGVEFNLNSPKQLGDVLFEQMKLPGGKKTKTGYSTSHDVLIKLVDKHAVIKKILRYRTLAKLFQTYINGLKDAIFDDGKVHTIYQQALTTTGRLSSIEPNLQNIPVRTPEGREIRKLFIPSNYKNYLLSADYSQIELRILAHVSEDKVLINAFNKGADIHTETAREVFHVDNVTPNMRSAAKAVNFGIIYGMSDWGLSDDLGISVKEAEQYINKYLEVYPDVKKYMTKIVEYGTKQGYVDTIFNRRRYLPELTSKVYMQRKFGERLALNAPIQGSAADILKKAMVDIEKYLTQNHKETKILLQVHDELILEVPPHELEEMKEKIPSLMTSAVKLLVDLPVSLAIGKTWYEI